jgi:hypothetical protein
MQAQLLLRERQIFDVKRFADVVIWRVPVPVRNSGHAFKYRLAYVVDDVCVLRFDNEAGKGDHKHIGANQVPYTFTTPSQLISDSWQAIADWRPQ